MKKNLLLEFNSAWNHNIKFQVIDFTKPNNYALPLLSLKVLVSRMIKDPYRYGEEYPFDLYFEFKN